MRFSPTAVHGVVAVDPEPHRDPRGFFARIFCADEFARHGLDETVAQCNLSLSRARGTLRGLHFQAGPAADSKLVRCLRGAIHDVVVDMRPRSPTYLGHVAVELTDENQRALYVPPMCAHGFQTLSDDVQILYQHSRPYSPDHERGLRYDDPAVGLTWPLEVTTLSDKDAAWPHVEPAR